MCMLKYILMDYHILLYFLSKELCKGCLTMGFIHRISCVPLNLWLWISTTFSTSSSFFKTKYHSVSETCNLFPKKTLNVSYFLIYVTKKTFPCIPTKILSTCLFLTHWLIKEIKLLYFVFISIWWHLNLLQWYTLQVFHSGRSQGPCDQYSVLFLQRSSTYGDSLKHDESDMF